MSEVEMYTDGACRGNPGPGGWGVLLLSNGTERELCGGDPATTNNRMELMAAIQGLSALTRPCKIDLYTDSKYVQHGITEWIANWKKRGWKTANRKPVKNEALWRELDELTRKHEVRWHWVKGHSGHPENERADQLANDGLEQAVRDE
jgi:ribonuclease HI